MSALHWPIWRAAYPQITCYSCEPDGSAFSAAVKNIGNAENVHLFNETSREFMRRLESQHDEIFQKPALFWLDAHGYGFEWPLRDEIAFITHKFINAFILVDDFKVPGNPHFGYDRYRKQECSFEYIRPAFAPNQEYHLVYPDYKDRTSAFHPLRGWALIYFGSIHLEIPPGLLIKIAPDFVPSGL